MVLKPSTVNGNTTTSIATANKGSVVMGTKTVDDAAIDSRNDAVDDDSDDEDDDEYSDFLAFLSTPTPSPNVSPAVEKKELVEPVAVEAEPVAIVVKKKKDVVKKATVIEVEKDEPENIGDVVIDDDVSVSTEESEVVATEDEKKVARESVSKHPPQERAAEKSSPVVSVVKPVSKPAAVESKQAPAVKSSKPAAAAAATAAKDEEATASATPIAIEYFTKQAAIDEANHAIEMRALAKANMPPAHAHFDKLNHAAALERSAQIEEMIQAPRPAAVEYFTALDLEKKQKAQADIADESMEQAPMAVEHFTTKAKEDKAKKAAEIEELKKNPPPPSEAGKHFQKVEAQRQAEIANMMNEPAPPAIEYFTTKAKEDKEKNERMLQELKENPPEASAATKHFEQEEKKKEQEQEAIRSQVKNASSMAVVEPLPFDHFNKQGQEETEARAKAARELSESHMPIGIKYFTAKGAEDKKTREAEMRQLSQQSQSMAGRHFAKLAEEKENASVTRGEAGAAEETMPAAIQHFTVADRDIKAKKKAEIELLKENPTPLSAGQEYFTSRDRDAKEKKAKEIQDLKDNPPIASAAAQHFAKVEEERKVALVAAANEPAPQAIEYFTNKANEEKSKRDLMVKELNENPPEASAATKHFEQEKQMKEKKMEAARAQAVKSSSREVVEPLPVDYFSKLGDKEVADRAEASKKLAESQMPSAIKYFTAKGEDEKKTREAQLRELSQQSQSMAGRHFAALAVEKEEAKKMSGSQSGDVEAMPAAIQHFTVMAREKSARKEEELKILRENPPPLSAGQAHFTDV